MKWMVSGDMRVPFTVEIEADTEQEAQMLVEKTDPKTFDYSLEGPGIDFSIDYAEPVDDYEVDVYLQALRAGFRLRLRNYDVWEIVRTESRYEELVSKGWQPYIIAECDIRFEPDHVSTAKAIRRALVALESGNFVYVDKRDYRQDK